jgi:maltose-binding protein MalE
MMTQRTFFLVLLVLAAGLLVVVRPRSDRTTILFWHAQSAENEAAFAVLTEQFMTTQPSVHVVRTAIPADELASRFALASAQGLGPDLILISHDDLALQIMRGLVQPYQLPESADLPFSAALLNPLRHEDQLFALPFSLNSPALYCNKTLLSEPAANLNSLLEQGRDGVVIAFNIRFLDSLWGVSAFGGHFFSESGLISPTPEALVSWLGWLYEAQRQPGFILSRDQAALRNLFLRGEAACVIDTPALLPAAREALGDAQVRIERLPLGTAGTPAAFSSMEVLSLNAASSDRATRAAREMALFLVNAEQGAFLLRQTGRIPANWRVRVDRRIYPWQAAFAVQARSAALIPPGTDRLLLERLGSTLYTNVLTGQQSTNDAVCAFMQELVQTTLPFDPAWLENHCRQGNPE